MLIIGTNSVENIPYIYSFSIYVVECISKYSAQYLKIDVRQFAISHIW